jgi:hypothetical protein
MSAYLDVFYLTLAYVITFAVLPPFQYIRPECVELSFFKNSKKVSTRTGNVLKSMCANPELDFAMDACCGDPNQNKPGAAHLCEFHLERTTYATAQSRCQNTGGDTCDWYSINNNNGCFDYQLTDNFHWTNEDCRLRAKGKL